MRSDRSLRDGEDFRRARRHGVRVARRGVTVFATRRPAGGPARLGLAVGRRCGGAVARNRIKRRLRAAFRCAGVPEGVDVVMEAGAPAAQGSFQELVDGVRRAGEAAAGS